jgi:two-component system cell cycle response regulator
MPGRILVVDDVATNRIILKVKLTGACYEVLQAGCGAEALRVAQRDRPDLILLDLAMPGLGGIEVCQRLKADSGTRDIPVIIVTSRADLRSKLAALEAGAEDFLTKPVDDLGLLARVRSLLRARSIAAELTLREGTCEALGFAEPAAEFTTAARIGLVAADETTAMAWKRTLSGTVRDRLEILTPGEALARAGQDQAPDGFVVAADLERDGDGLMLLSELRSRLQTRHAAIVVAVDPEARKTAAMALDLGASDIIHLPLDPQEMRLRMRTQLSRKRQADRLRRRVRDGLQLAVTDPLTGLYNRRYAMSHLARIQQRSEKSGRGFAVMLIDLDNFKGVNDTYGHAAGDSVLQAVGQILMSNLRSVDLVARVGGEEFMVILPDVEPDAALGAAERLRGVAATTPIRLPKRRSDAVPVALHQTISVGLATTRVNPMGRSEDIRDMLERVDHALYKSKSDGRNLVTCARDCRQAA